MQTETAAQTAHHFNFADGPECRICFTSLPTETASFARRTDDTVSCLDGETDICRACCGGVECVNAREESAAPKCTCHSRNGVVQCEVAASDAHFYFHHAEECPIHSDTRQEASNA